MRYVCFYAFLAIVSAAAAGAQIVLDPAPARVMGHQATTPAEQLTVTSFNPNFDNPGGLYSPEGVAVDTGGSTPTLYVADTFNNRILAWQNATSSTLSNLQAPSFIIGQPNSSTTIPLTANGLYYPTGLLVDPNHNLYVVDSGNNRVLRFPAPVSSSTAPDIVIGQPDRFNLSSSVGNQGLQVPTAYTVCLYQPVYPSCPVGSEFFFASLAMDSAGNLFLSDAGNSRVLRYPAASLNAAAMPIAADLVVGQLSFGSPTGASGPLDKNILYGPAGLAFDPGGNLFVTDSLSRLVLFPPTVSTSPAGTNGITAERLAGIVSPTPATATAKTLFNPNGIVIIGSAPAVADSGNNRMLFYDPFKSSDWSTTDSTLANPPVAALSELGQGSSLNNFTSSAVNGGNPGPCVSPCTPGAEVANFSSPVAAAVGVNGDLFIVDAGNDRVLVYANGGSVATASHVLGQSDFAYNSPNSIEGDEFDFGTNFSGDAGLVVDSTTGSTQHLYVADPNNNRVLGFADARKAGLGLAADVVIGQPLQAGGGAGVFTGLCNAGAKTPTATTLCYPTGLAVDPASGDLYVADTSNGRVLRFPAPFAAANAGLQPTANLVLGQGAFTGASNPQASQTVMVAPYGLVFDPQRGLFVSDESANRVLLFQVSTCPVTSCEASEAIGQADFSTTTATAFSQPHHIGEDSIGRVYVSDYVNNRVQVFLPSGQFTTQAITSLSVTQFGGSLSGPQAVWVNSNTIAGTHDDIWVGDRNGISHFTSPSLSGSGSNQATLTETAAQVVVPVQSPGYPGCSSAKGKPPCTYGLTALAITQDGLGNLYVADASNRVGIHYQALLAENSASYVCYMGCTLGTWSYPCLIPTTGASVSCGLAPGAFATLYPSNYAFTTTTAEAGTLPLPITLAGLQVLLNGQASPLSVVTQPNPAYPGYMGQVNFVVPFEAPTAGSAEMVVVNTSTSQVLGSGTVTMGNVSPAFFTANASGMGQIAALNCNTVVNGSCDNTPNGTAAPVNPGEYIQLFLTGQGNIPGHPPDGQGTSGQVPTPVTPLVYIGGTTTPANVTYSGLAPGYPGLWQINIQIPTKLTNLGSFVPVTGASYQIFPVQILYQGFATNLAPNNANPSTAATIVINAPE